MDGMAVGVRPAVRKMLRMEVVWDRSVGNCSGWRVLDL